MDFFEKLGRTVDDQWRIRHYDQDAFPEIATRVLAEMPPADNVGTYAPLQAFMTNRDALLIGRADFGQPPVQVYGNRRFYIEALYWLDGTTSIHEHAFCGAFHVMAGSSIHCLYQFEEDKRFNGGTLTGRLVRQSVELCKKGDTRPILPGRAMAHSLFHLDQPSVTIVVRTGHALGVERPQYSYTFPGLAEDPFYAPDLVARLSMACQTLHQVAHPELDQILSQTFANAEPQVAVSLAMALRMQGIFQSAAHAREILEPARKQHGDLVDALVASVEVMGRQDVVRALRGRLRNAEHRFFLALLLHFDTGAEVLSFVARRYPGSDPGDLVLRWLNECTQVDDPLTPGQKVLNLQFDGSMLAVMKPMLAGRPLDEVMAKLGEEFEAEDLAAQAADIQRLHRSLSAHRVFGPLFR
jgi:hypothetical protein